ncbi:MAG TPA: tyrosine-protein phosphatase [Elusimicrobiota bacterium]|nr:tyrosine-protein phosphatase [Elusimicrobiota bacterium]
MKTLLIAALFALPARAQETAPLARAVSDAQALVAAGPGPGTTSTRPEPDADSDSDVEPLEALGNLHTVEPGLLRSAQPSKEGYATLRGMGVKTILNLKDKLSAERERAKARPYGISVENVAMSGFSTPTFAQMDRALEVLKTAPRPILVHCAHGKDRTGFVVASYRVIEEKVSIPDAVQEAKDAGCCFVMFEDLSSFLRKYRVHRRAKARPSPK